MDSSLIFQLDQDKTRLEGLRQSLQTANRVLTGRELTVKFVDKLDANPAWSTPNEITINLGRIGDVFSDEGMATVLGLNYHEVAHVLYSPADLTDLFASIRDVRPVQRVQNNFREAYKVLEENRIETFYSNRYPRLKKWFTYPVVEILVKEKSNWDTAFLTTHGRRYLSKDIRKKFRDIYENKNGKADTDRLAELIDRYRFLPVGKISVSTEAAEVINEFARILGDSPFPESQHGNRIPTGAGNNVRQAVKDADNAKETEEEQEEEEKEQEQEQEEQDQPDPEDEEEEEEPREKDQSNEPDPQQDSEEEQDDEGAREEQPDDESDGEPGDSEDGDGEASDLPDGDAEDGSGGGDDSEEDDDDPSESWVGDVPEDADGGEDGDSAVGDAGRSDSGKSAGDEEDGGPDSSGESQPGSTSGGSSGGVSASVEAPTDEEVEEALNGILQEVLASDEAREEISNTRSAMESTGTLDSTLIRETGTPMLVSPDMFRNAEALSDIFRQVWTRMEAGWEYGTSDGSRIDMTRAAMARDPEDYDSIYDDWQPGQQDDSRIAAVICADNSLSTKYSVGGLTYQSVASVISKNIWELKKSLQEIEATVTVLCFNTRCGTLYNRDENVNDREYIGLWPHGGTVPSDALDEARRILSFTEEPKKILVMVTDGHWSGGENVTYGESLDHLGEMGVVRLAILVGALKTEDFAYKAHFDVVSQTGGDIAGPISALVVRLMENGMN